MTAICKNFKGTSYLLDKAIREQDNENDSCYLVCGPEGIGKSNLMLDCIDYIEKKTNQEITIDRICRNLKELIVQLKHSRHKSILALDEGEELSSDNQYDVFVKAVKKMYSVMRFKKIISFICFRNPLRIHTYFREDRVKGVFVIIKRGQAIFFTRTAFLQVLEDIRKFHGGIRSIKQFNKFKNKATLIDTFPKYEGHLLAAYKKRKEEGANQDIDDLYEEFGVEEKIFSLSQACKYVGMNDDLLRRYLCYEEETTDSNRIIPVQWNLARTKMRIKEKDLIIFINWYEVEKAKKLEQQAHTIYKKENLKQKSETGVKENEI